MKTFRGMRLPRRKLRETGALVRPLRSLSAILQGMPIRSSRAFLGGALGDGGMSYREPWGPEAITRRQELFDSLNKYISHHGGWLTSVPGAKTVRFGMPARFRTAADADRHGLGGSPRWSHDPHSASGSL